MKPALLATTCRPVSIPWFFATNLRPSDGLAAERRWQWLQAGRGQKAPTAMGCFDRIERP